MAQRSAPVADLSELAHHELKNRRSSPEVVSDVLRHAILNGILPSGSVLRQDDIATQFGMSRIPVREALRQLEGEGLVTFNAHRGVSVSQISIEELQEICEIRIALETTALRLAIPHLTEEDFRQAAQILDETNEDHALRQWSENNWRFHSTLYAPSGRPLLLSMVKTLHNNVDRYLRLHVSLLHYQRKGQQEHRKILAACERRDVKLATRLLDHHINGVADLLTSFFHHEDGADGS